MKHSVKYSLLCGALAVLTQGAGLFAAEEALLPPLTTVPHSPRLPGKFVWADLVTDDVPAARAFYSHLFGWTFREIGNYTIASNDERPLCGLVQRSRPADGTARPRWFGYLSVDSVEKAKRAAIEGGGRLITPPQTFAKRGEQAVFADPEGAVFGVIKSSSGDPEDFLPDPGDWIWIQLLSRDAGKAAAFYRALGGYEVIENTASNRLSDHVLASGGYARATVRTIPAERQQVRPTWLLFVRVKTIGESLASTRLWGGKVLLEPQPELFDGKVAVIADPTGAAIGLMEWSDTLSKGAQ
jgi:predicted enzyme related to lactoylglutathione lyase